MGNIKVGVVPAAGPGSRLGYLSSILPKSLFPLLDRPIIHHVMNNFQKLGIESAFVIVGFQKQRIKDYFRNVKDSIDLEISFVTQKKLTGIAAAIALVQNWVNDPFVCILGDDITISPLTGLPIFFREKNAIAVQAVVEEPNIDSIRNTCCVKLDRNDRIVRILEKPRNPVSKLRGCGVYVFDESIFDYIKRTPRSITRGEREITDVIDHIAQKGRAFGWRLEGRNFNINTSGDLFEAWAEVRRERGNGDENGSQC